MKLNKDQFDQVMSIAAKIENAAEKLDKVSEVVVDVAARLSNGLELWAENVRTEAEKNYDGAGTEDNLSDTESAVWNDIINKFNKGFNGQ